VNSLIGGGENNTAYAHYSTVGGGRQNTTIGWASSVSGGEENTASGAYSTIGGGWGALAANYGEFAQASGRFKNQGDAQTSVMVVRDSTVDAVTNVDLKLDGAYADMTLPGNAIWGFRAMVVGADSAAGTAAWEITGLVRGGAFVGVPNVTAIANPAGWTAPVAAVLPGNKLAIRVRGSTAYRTYWVARVEVVQVRM